MLSEKPVYQIPSQHLNLNSKVSCYILPFISWIVTSPYALIIDLPMIFWSGSCRIAQTLVLQLQKESKLLALQSAYTKAKLNLGEPKVRRSWQEHESLQNMGSILPDLVLELILVNLNRKANSKLLQVQLALLVLAQANFLEDLTQALTSDSKIIWFGFLPMSLC